MDRCRGNYGTGTGGLTGTTVAIPLLTKGTGQAEMPANLNMNYFLGISGGRLAADFEDNAGGVNHPVIGTATITTGVWHHAAATYDGTTWRLFLDGALDRTFTLASAFTPESTSIQHAAIGSALTSTGAAAGFFGGVIDEVRIWNVVRTPTQILANMNLEVTSGTGLIGRWGLNEGGGIVAFNSVAGRPTGTLTNGPTRVVGGVLGIPPDAVAPSTPQNVVADAGNDLVTITWAENPEFDLAGYNVYKDGSGSPLNVSPLTSPIFTDHTATNGSASTYAVRAIDTSSNTSALSTAAIATPNALAGAGMQFNGTNQFVTFGPAAGTATGLGAQTFTLETWFKRTGVGVATTTGTGGTLPGITDAIPLITKGMAESESPLLNMNYFLGISASTGRLVADFEDTVNGGNHPVSGTTAIPISTTAWHHAAATYDGDEWRIYLDGALETTLLVGAFTPESTSTQHAAIATALDSSGDTGTNPQGFFHGILEEVRIWDRARDQSQIQAAMHQQIVSAPELGLIGRWGLNEASGTTVVSTARAINGTASGTPTWTAGYPYPLYSRDASSATRTDGSTCQRSRQFELDHKFRNRPRRVQRLSKHDESRIHRGHAGERLDARDIGQLYRPRRYERDDLLLRRDRRRCVRQRVRCVERGDRNAARVAEPDPDCDRRSGPPDLAFGRRHVERSRHR